jgi:hypothetical protein
MQNTVESLWKYANELISVPKNSKLKIIQTKMLRHKVSLIPLMQNSDRDCVGVIRIKQIWEMTLSNPDVDINLIEAKDFMDSALPIVSCSDDLNGALDKLRKTSAILVRGDEKKIEKIITPRVVATAFIEYSKEFHIIDLLESRIRKILERVSKSDLEKLVINETDINKFSFRDYQNIFSNCWELLNIDYLDKKQIMELIGIVMPFRNEVMHFRKDRTPNGLESATQLSNLLKDI